MGYRAFLAALSVELGQEGAGGVQHLAEQRLVKRGTLSAHLRRVDVQQAVQPHLAGSLLAVPCPAAHVHQCPAGSANRRFAGKQQTCEKGASAPDDEHWTVFAFAGVVLKRYGCPHDLAWICTPVGVRCVRNEHRPGSGSPHRWLRMGVTGASPALRWPHGLPTKQAEEASQHRSTLAASSEV